MIVLTTQRPELCICKSMKMNRVLMRKNRNHHPCIFNSPKTNRSSSLVCNNNGRREDDQLQTETTSSGEFPPPGCARYSVVLSKPLGLVLEENKEAGTIVVADVVDGGNAQANGEINIGDTLIATSGYTRTTEQVYGEIVVRGGEQLVRLLCRGESFETVMAAIGSHPASIGVKLEFQRCDLE